MTLFSEPLVLEPGRAIGPFHVGMGIAAIAEIVGTWPERRPASKWHPGFLHYPEIGVRFHIATTPLPGVDEIEVTSGWGTQVVAFDVPLLGRVVDAVLSDLEGTGAVVTPDAREPTSSWSGTA